MRHGRIVGTAPVSRLFDAARHPYSRTLIDAHAALSAH